MNISKNGFYKLSEINSNEIIIDNNITVSIFDDLPPPSPLLIKEGEQKGVVIKIGENTKLDFYGVLENKNDFKINFFQDKQNSNLKVRYLLLSKNDDKLKANIYSSLNSNNSKSDVKILSIIGDNGFVDLDGIIKIENNIEKVEGNLIEENLFLGEGGIIKGVPTLLVRSDDVKASHSCKMEKISDEDLFYMRSRGIGKENALNMMIEAKIETLFSEISLQNKDFYNNIKNDILTKI